MTLTAPAPTTDAQTTIAQEAQHVVQTYPRPPFVLTHGEGVTLYDSTGNAYLDMVAGIAVNALGYSDPDLTAAITAQADQLIHVSNLYHTAPQAKLAAQLCDLSFADKVFFNNSGSKRTRRRSSLRANGPTPTNRPTQPPTAMPKPISGRITWSIRRNS
jgi:acetylornithine/succinyldiaminopimelate/putrescine aminotransferase